jgi:hypothetical protein
LTQSSTSTPTPTIETPVNFQQEINLDAPFLEQNAPNPFNGSTTIRYYLPEENQSAVLQVMNINGQILTTRTLENQGHGTVTLNIGEMPEGSYSYALVMDGQVVDTKQMVVVK